MKKQPKAVYIIENGGYTELTYALFYEEKTERVYAEQIGVSPSTVHRRREKIIKKLKNYLK